MAKFTQLVVIGRLLRPGSNICQIHAISSGCCQPALSLFREEGYILPYAALLKPNSRRPLWCYSGGQLTSLLPFGLSEASSLKYLRKLLILTNSCSASNRGSPSSLEEGHCAEFSKLSCKCTVVLRPTYALRAPCLPPFLWSPLAVFTFIPNFIYNIFKLLHF